MSELGISNELRRFILETIDSIGQLEALLLCRESSAAEWTVQRVAQRLYISEKETADLLNRLGVLGMLSALEGEPTRYVYRPASPELASLVDQLARAYSTQLVPITNLIHGKSKIQQFADAFRIRKEEP